MTNPKSYTDKKIDGYIDALVDGDSEYLKLRNDSVDGSGNRIGTQKIEFLRTTSAEAFGANQCADWKIGTDSTCGLNIYRKGTHPTLGVLYDGNVIEFEQDGDVNVVKVGGLKINNAEVATKSYTDATFAAIGVEQSVSDLSTTSSDHGQRLVTIENAGYATTSQLSAYALSSSLGTTNTNLNGVDTRVNTLENAGYITTPALQAYSYATEVYVQTAVDILNNTNIGATASSGATAGVNVTNQASGTGVDFNFTIPPGADGNDGVTPTIAVTTTQGTAGGDASVSASTSGTTTTLAFTMPPGATGASGTGGLDANGVLSISKNGEVAKFQPATSGQYTLVNFNSKVNSGSDKGFILVQDESAQSPGTSTEDLRMTIGVHNDFLQSTAHSDELWLQGGGRLCYNVGSWESELNTIIGTPGAGTSHGGVKHEWRINISAKLTLNSSGNLGIGKTPGSKLDVAGRIRANANGGSLQLVGTDHTYIEYYPDGTSSGRKAYVGYANGSDNTFTISNSAGSGYVNFNGGNVGIGTGSPAQKLDVNGNINLDGSGRQIYFDTGGAGLYWGSGYSRIVDDGDLHICTDDNLHFNTGCNSSSLGTERMVLLSNGNFGINQSSPDRTLDVNGTCDIASLLRVYGGLQVRGYEATVNYTNAQSDYLTNGGSVQADPPTLLFGLYVQYSIRAQAIVVTSDQRIKSNVVDINDTIALDQVRKLKPKYYEYKDKVKRGASSVIGFIAQDVKEVLPRAVSVADGEIPNIYEIATISSSNTVTFTNFNTSNLDGLGKLITYLAEDKREELTITEVVGEHTVLVEEDMSEWGSELFVWGQKVDDFHHLDKSYIFTVATAALQEVDRQLQAEKVRNDALEARILALETVIANL